ncbi:hypothetical protein GCM10023237_24910 [Streptomyces coeruleoprunus]
MSLKSSQTSAGSEADGDGTTVFDGEVVTLVDGEGAVVSLCDGDGAVVWLSDVEGDGAVVSLCDGDGLVSVVDSDAEGDGEPSVANAAGAIRKAAGVMTAVAAATAMARRSFKSRPHGLAYHWVRHGVCGASVPCVSRAWPLVSHR